MTSQPPPAPAPRQDPRRLVNGAKFATLVASAVGFGAVAGLVIANPVGTAAATGTPAVAVPAQTPAPASADDFFSAPPGFVQPQMIDGGSSGQSGVGGQAGSGTQGGFGTQGGSGGQGGFGGQMPGMRSGGS